jgi:hypothetical protein
MLVSGAASLRSAADNAGGGLIEGILRCRPSISRKKKKKGIRLFSSPGLTTYRYDLELQEAYMTPCNEITTLFMLVELESAQKCI